MNRPVFPRIPESRRRAQERAAARARVLADNPPATPRAATDPGPQIAPASGDAPRDPATRDEGATP